VETLLKSNGVDLLRGKAVFVDNKTIEVKSEKISSTYFIIATGSLPIMPQINGIDNPAVMDSSKALDLESIPEKLLIIGAGVIGLEFACIYQSLGSKVIIVELLEDMLPNLDRDIANILHKALVNKGIKVFFGSKIVKINEYNAIIDVKGEEKIIPFDGVLVAVGRRPNYNGIENLSYLIKDGKIGVNDRMQTEIDNIYAIGDVVGPYQLAHVASYQGIIAASNIAGIDKKISYRAVPSCMYTNPEVSWVGFNERQARDKYGEIKVGRFPYFILPKAVLVGERDGLIKVVADEKNNTILGFSIIGKKATEVIHEAVVAIDAGYTVDAFAQIIHAHPTISEGIKEACEDLLGNPINKLKNV
jgi:dihydrolipoamide dehydrogenase